MFSHVRRQRDLRAFFNPSAFAKLHRLSVFREVTDLGWISEEGIHFLFREFRENIHIPVYGKGMRRVLGYQYFGLLFVIVIPARKPVTLFSHMRCQRDLRAFFHPSAVAEINLLTVFGDIPRFRRISNKVIHFFLGEFRVNVHISVYGKGMRRVLGYQRFGLLFVIVIPAEEVVSFVRNSGKRDLRAYFHRPAVAEINLLVIFGDITAIILVTLRKEIDLFHDSDRDDHL